MTPKSPPQSPQNNSTKPAAGIPSPRHGVRTERHAPSAQTRYSRPSFEGMALGFVGACVIGLYGMTALDPLSPSAFSFPTFRSIQPAYEAVLAPMPAFEQALTAKSENNVAEESAPLVASAAKTMETVFTAIKPATKPGAVYGASREESIAENKLSQVQPLVSLGGGVIVHSTDGLARLFSTLNYRLEDVRHGLRPVPRVLLSQFPKDMDKINQITQRKNVFIKAMLPLVLYVNETLSQERSRLIDLRSETARGGHISAKDAIWLAQMAERYDLDQPDIEALLNRVDIIPPALALAQAIEESGWGTSRFAQEGNAPFGMWTYNEEMGIVPHEREDGERHAVRAYEHLIDGVRAYIHNLNSHAAYREFRIHRADMRRRGEDLDSQSLVGTMVRYSERGPEYIATLLRIMKANDLAAYDQSRLNGTVLAALSPGDG